MHVGCHLKFCSDQPSHAQAEANAVSKKDPVPKQQEQQPQKQRDQQQVVETPKPRKRRHEKSDTSGSPDTTNLASPQALPSSRPEPRSSSRPPPPLPVPLAEIATIEDCLGAVKGATDALRHLARQPAELAARSALAAAVLSPMHHLMEIWSAVCGPLTPPFTQTMTALSLKDMGNLVDEELMYGRALEEYGSQERAGPEPFDTGDVYRVLLQLHTAGVAAMRELGPRVDAEEAAALRQAELESESIGELELEEDELNDRFGHWYLSQFAAEFQAELATMAEEGPTPPDVLLWAMRQGASGFSREEKLVVLEEQELAKRRELRVQHLKDEKAA
jgi:hypothetical protein